MRYTKEIQNYLNVFEKKFKLNLEDLFWVESELSRIYEDGFDWGQKTRSEKDYDEGYKDGKEAEKDNQYYKDSD
jgi:hypothetical protein